MWTFCADDYELCLHDCAFFWITKNIVVFTRSQKMFSYRLWRITKYIVNTDDDVFEMKNELLMFIVHHVELL